MEESTRWIVGIIITILLGLLMWALNIWRARHKDWLMTEFASLRRADSKNGKAVENMVAKVESIEERQHGTDRKVAVHDEKHRTSENSIEKMERQIDEIHKAIVPKSETG